MMLLATSNYLIWHLPRLSHDNDYPFPLSIKTIAIIYHFEAWNSTMSSSGALVEVDVTEL